MYIVHAFSILPAFCAVTLSPNPVTSMSKFSAYTTVPCELRNSTDCTVHAVQCTLYNVQFTGYLCSMFIGILVECSSKHYFHFVFYCLPSYVVDNE